MFSVPLSASRPSRHFAIPKPFADPISEELKDLRDAREARRAKIYAVDDEPPRTPREDPVQKDLKKKEEERLAQLKYEKKNTKQSIF